MKKIILILFALISGLGIFQKIQADESEAMLVMATIPPLTEFAERVGGSHVRVETMIPPGANPHTYEPTPSQLKLLSQTKVYIAVGSNIEFELTWLSKIKSLNPDIQICNASKGIHFINSNWIEPTHKDEHVHGRFDPHTWLSPKNAVQMVKNINVVFAEADPANKDDYGKETNLYIETLQELDSEIRSELDKFRGSEFFVYHPAWAYFADEYELKEVSIEFEGKEPTAKRFSGLIEEMKAKKVRTIFTSPFSSSKNASVVANALNAKLQPIDELAKNYIENIRLVAGKIKEALE